MKLHRYFLDQDLPHDFWMDDPALFRQWTKVLRYEVGREVVLFNNQREVRLYIIKDIGNDAAHVQLITEMEPLLPSIDLYVCFSLLKKDKVEWVLQKGTELGVSHFVPLLCDRTEKTGWNTDRAQKIVIEAAEQCERGDIPRLREPLSPRKLIEELSGIADIYIAEQNSPGSSVPNLPSSKPLAVLIGPEGGWSNEEKEFFAVKNLPHISLSHFTLRAETAAITAAALMHPR